MYVGHTYHSVNIHCFTFSSTLIAATTEVRAENTGEQKTLAGIVTDIGTSPMTTSMESTHGSVQFNHMQCG